MKTLHLTNAWHAASGGIGTFYRALIDAANREQHAMRLIVPGDSTYTEQAGEFARIYHIEAPRAPFNPEYRMLYPQRFLFARTVIQKILNEERPDLVEISDKYTLHYLTGLLRTRRLPGILFRPTVIGLSHERMEDNFAAYFRGGEAGRRFCRWYMKRIYFPMLDHHIAVSRHTADELELASRGHMVRRGIWIEPMGVDAARFTPLRRSASVRAELVRRAGAREGSTILLYAGRIAPEKNLELLVETMARLEPSGDFHLAIAGDGILRDELASQFRERGIRRVTFLGHIANRDELADIYANSDIFMHANPREPFGIAPLEAMASGLPLIAPDSGGVTTYATQENAWLSKPDADAFADCARYIRTQPASAERRSAIARRTAETFAWPNVTSRFLKLYRAIHAMVRGENPDEDAAPVFWSSLGDRWGREIEDCGRSIA